MRQRVEATDLRIDQVRLVVLPARLVLLRAAVVVDGEQCRAGGLGRGTEIHRRLAAPGADLDEGRGRGRREAGLAGAQGGGEQRLAFVVGHEPPGLTGRLEECLDARRVEGVVAG